VSKQLVLVCRCFAAPDSNSMISSSSYKNKAQYDEKVMAAFIDAVETGLCGSHLKLAIVFLLFAISDTVALNVATPDASAENCAVTFRPFRSIRIDLKAYHFKPFPLGMVYN
jgi:hypothetical protein